MAKQKNPKKLTEELIRAGIAVGGCNKDGVVWGADGKTEIQDQPEVQAVLNAHNQFTPSIAEIARTNALTAARAHNGTDIGAIPMPDMSDIIRALCAEHGWVDTDGAIQIPEQS